MYFPIGAIAGFAFVLLIHVFVFNMILEWLTIPTALFVGMLSWMLLFFWRNFGGGNVIQNRIDELRNQIDYMQDDIREMNERRIPGRRAEIRHLQKRIHEMNNEIDELERLQ